MRITSQLKIISISTLVALGVMLLVLLWAVLEFRVARNDYALAQAIRNSFFERTSYKDQYFLYREERIRQQWEAGKKLSDQLIDQARLQFHNEDELQLLGILSRDLDETASIFDRIVANAGRQQLASVDHEVYEELDKRLYSQLLLKSSRARDRVSQLMEMSSDRAEHSYFFLSVSIGLFAFALAFFTILNSARLVRLLRRRLAPLHDGAKIVAGGDLNHRIPRGGKDEFSELADSFNAMADKLNAEINQHKKSEAALIKVQTLLDEIEQMGRAGGWEFYTDTGKLIWTQEVYNIHEVDTSFALSVEKAMDFYAPQSKPVIQRAVQNAIENAEPFDVELEIITAKGKVRNVHAIGKADPEHSRVFGFFQDVTERKQRESLLAFRLKLSDMAAEADYLKLMQATLDQAEKLTDSSIGFFHFVEDDQETTSLQTWSTNTLENMCKAEGGGQHYPVSEAGVWADGIRSKQAVIQNDYSHLEHKKGMPQGHATVHRFISIPLIRNNKIVAMIGVGNKLSDYDATDVAIATELADAVFDLIQANRARQLLAESEEKFRKITESAQDAIIMMGADKRITAWNPAAENLFGYSAGEAIGKDLHGLLVPPEAQAIFEQGFQRFQEIGTGPLIGKVTEVVAMRKGGALFPAEVSLSTLKIVGQWHAIGFLRDIFERKRAQEILQQNEQLYRLLFDSSPMPMWVFDESSLKFLMVNERAIEHYGYTREEFLQMNLLDICPHEDVAMLKQVISNTPDRHALGEWRHKKKDGSLIDVMVHAEPFLYADVPARIALIEDISERKRSEIALRDSEARFRAMVENELLGITILRDRKVKWVNPAFENMLGYDKGELADVPMRQVYFTEEGYRAIGEEAYPVLNEGKIYRAEIELKRKDGSPIWVDMSGIMLDGETREYLLECVDTTERVQSERELKRSNAELEQFSYAISHDMRQPLRMISSYLQLMKMSLADKLDETNSEYFKYAIQGAQRLDKMLLDMLDYSRVGRKHDPFVWGESRALLDEAIMFMNPLIVESKAELEIAGVWPRVKVSHNEIERLLHNLIDNAVKYRKPGQSPRISITSQVQGGRWRICVTDDGIGINPSQIGRLFQMFQRLQSHANYEGNGIGLVLCRKIAEHHGGRIWVESAGEGMGSSFCVEFPMRDEKE